MYEKKLAQLAEKMSQVLPGQDSTTTMKLLEEIKVGLDDGARKVSGVRADELANEDMESSPIVLLYWQTRSYLEVKMLMLTAQNASYYKELDQ